MGTAFQAIIPVPATSDDPICTAAARPHVAVENNSYVVILRRQGRIDRGRGRNLSSATTYVYTWQPTKIPPTDTLAADKSLLSHQYVTKFLGTNPQKFSLQTTYNFEKLTPSLPICSPRERLSGNLFFYLTPGQDLCHPVTESGRRATVLFT